MLFIGFSSYRFQWVECDLLNEIRSEQRTDDVQQESLCPMRPEAISSVMKMVKLFLIIESNICGSNDLFIHIVYYTQVIPVMYIIYLCNIHTCFQIRPFSFVHLYSLSVLVPSHLPYVFSTFWSIHRLVEYFESQCSCLHIRFARHVTGDRRNFSWPRKL